MKSLFYGLAVVLVACSSSPGDEASSSQSADSERPVALGGTYSFQGEVKPVGRLTVDVIDLRMPDAQERLTALDDAGAACAVVDSNTYRCTLMHAPSDVAQASLDALAAQNHDRKLTFGALKGDPSVTNDAEDLTDWDIPQSGSGPLGDFDSYVFRSMKNGPDKIIVNERDEYLVEDGGRIQKWAEHVISEGRWRFHRDAAVVVLSN